MNMFRALGVLWVVLAFPAFAFADLNFGLGAGVNYDELTGTSTRPLPIRSVNVSGLSWNAVAALTLFQERPFGLVVSGDVINFGGVGGSDSLKGIGYVASVSPQYS